MRWADIEESYVLYSCGIKNFWLNCYLVYPKAVSFS